MYKRLILLGALFLSSCSSAYVNLSKNSSGLYKNVYLVKEKEDKIFQITVISGAKPWESFEKPRQVFLQIAHDVCSGEYETLSTNESSYNAVASLGELKYIKSEVNGKVKCADSSVITDKTKDLKNQTY